MSRAGSDRPDGHGRRRPAGGSLALAVSLALAMALWAGPVEARRPRPYLVQKVASGLVIHQEPRPTSPRVGQIPAAAQGLVASGRRRRAGRAIWHEVQYQGVRGWVNAPRLQRKAAPIARAARAPSDAGVFMEDLVCTGRSPDWKLVIDRDGTVACSVGCASAAQLRAIPAQQDRRSRGSWRMSIRDDQGHDVMMVSLRYTGQCLDGLSDDRYAYRVSTLTADGARQSGCCNRLEPTITTAAP